MIKYVAVATLAILAFTMEAAAGNTSSNSSSNSSGGIHTRVDTIVTEDEYGRRIVERRSYHRDRRDPFRGFRDRGDGDAGDDD
jgi:hypothetical protein